jgi:hypothetical protein
MLREVCPALGIAVALVLGSVVGCGTADTANQAQATKPCGKVILDGGGGIVKPANGSLAPECGAGACNFQSRAGCSDTQTCLPALSGSDLVAACLDAGTSADGTACDGQATCGVGATCVEGQCRKLCCAGDWTVCDQGESCYRELEYQIGDAIVQTGTWVCSAVGTCSVLDPQACDASGEDCKIVDSRGSEACMPKTGGALGEACGASQNRLCGRGLTCVGEPGAETCRRLCRAEECGDPSCPTAEGACVHFDRDPAGVGECTPGW